MDIKVNALDPATVDWKAVTDRMMDDLFPSYRGRWFFRGVLGWPHAKLQARASRRRPRPEPKSPEQAYNWWLRKRLSEGVATSQAEREAKAAELGHTGLL